MLNATKIFFQQGHAFPIPIKVHSNINCSKTGWPEAAYPETGPVDCPGLQWTVLVSSGPSWSPLSSPQASLPALCSLGFKQSP